MHSFSLFIGQNTKQVKSKASACLDPDSRRAFPKRKQKMAG